MINIMKLKHSLFKACRNDDHELLSSCIDQDISNAFSKLDVYRQCNSLLHVACEFGALKCVKYLVENIPELCFESNRFCSYPLHSACAAGNIECIEILLSNDSCLVNIDLPGYEDRTALHLAVLQNRIDIVTLLLHCGADSNAFDRYGKLALHMVVSIECAAVLIISGNAYVDGKDMYGQTFVHYCCATDKAMYLKFLLTQSPNLAIKDTLGRTPLHVAASHGSQSCLDLLLKTKTLNINLTDLYGWTALHITVRQINFMATVSLLKAGADPGVRDNLHRTALHFACQNGTSMLTVVQLLAHGSNIDDLTRDRQTPLHYACAVMIVDNPIVSTLLDLGASITAKDYVQSTPLHLAVQSNQIKSVSRILHYANRCGSDVAGGNPLMRLLPTQYIGRWVLYEHNIPRNKAKMLHCVLNNQNIGGHSSLATCCAMQASRGTFNICILLLLCELQFASPEFMRHICAEKHPYRTLLHHNSEYFAKIKHFCHWHQKCAAQIVFGGTLSKNPSRSCIPKIFSIDLIRTFILSYL